MRRDEKRRKILIVYASAGVGHKKAAESIYEVLKENNKDDEIYLEDILNYTSRLFRFLYSDVYIFLIKYLKDLWGFLFYLSNSKIFLPIFESFKALAEISNTKKFQCLLIKEGFNLVISTHFSSSYIVGYLKKAKRIKTKLLTVVTDYRAHSVWFVKESDYFIVADDRTKIDLIKGNINEDKIKILGIPVGIEFSTCKDKNLIRDKLGIKSKKLTIMIMGGGAGIGPYEYLLRRFSPYKDMVNLLFICGYDSRLYNSLTFICKETDAPFKVYGYVNNVDELMEISDIIVTKAGGITLTESLVKRLPMLVISPIPGQEGLNSKLMEELGVMKVVNNKKEAYDFLKGLIDNPGILLRMRNNISKIVKPEAVKEVADFARRVI